MKELSAKQIAKERIEILFNLAKEIFNENPKFADRYVFIARKIAMRFNIKLTKEQKKKFCHKCYSYLYPGKNCIIRTNPKTKCVEYLCKNCGKKTRYGYSSESKNKS